MRRIARATIAVVVLATAFVVVPPPAIAWASDLETLTTQVVLTPVERSARASGLVAAPAASHDEHGREVTSTTTPTVGAAGSGLDPFTAIGATTSAAPSAPLSVRVALDGVWGPWREIEADDDHRPDGDEASNARPGFTTEPLFVGRGDAYELEVPADAGTVSVHLVTETARRLQIVDDTDRAGSAPSIASRSAWGARAPATAPSDAGELKLAVVHHSVTNNGYTRASVPAMLRSIQAYHMDANGWNDIAYNFAVDRFGQVWEARAGGIDRAIIGGHAYGFNTESTGVVVLGDYGSAAPSGAAVDAVERVLAWKMALHQTPTTGTVTYRSAANTHFGPAGTPVRVQRISGHRDVRQTSCPGASLYSRLPSIRQRVLALTPGAQAEAPPLAVGGDRNGDGRDDLLLYRPGAASDRNLIGTGGSGGLLDLTTQPPDFAVSSTSISGAYTPLSGDFDGDGRSDVFWYRPGSGIDYLWYGTSNGGRRSVSLNVSGEYEPLVGDFDGDGRDDVFWYGVYGERDYVWFGKANGFVSAATNVSGNYEPQVGDFDGDGRDDVLWYGAGSRIDSVWYGNANRRFSSRRLSIGGWFQPLVGDFTGDGRDDVFWYRAGAASDHLWNGTAARGFGSVSRNVGGTYDPVVGDFDGNGFDDIFWNSPDGRADYQWYSHRSGYTSGAARIDAGRRMQAVDSDGNGDDEIFSIESATRSRLWDRRADGSFSNRVIT